MYLKGIKRTMYEGGLRSPMVAYWPGKINAGTKNDHLSAFWDMLPTFSELTGEPIVGNSDGISMLPTLLGKNLFQKKHEYLYWELYEGRPNSAVRYGKWKGVVRDRREGNEIQLFNLEIDESETNNVAKQNPEIVLEIQSIMEKSHEKNPFWDKDFKPLFNAEAASKVNGVKADIGNKYYKPQKLNK